MRIEGSAGLLCVLLGLGFVIGRGILCWLVRMMICPFLFGAGSSLRFSLRRFRSGFWAYWTGLLRVPCQGRAVFGFLEGSHLRWRCLRGLLMIEPWIEVLGR